jgi:hypothetical protein
VPDANLWIYTGCHQVLVLKQFQRVYDRILAHEHFLHVIIHRIIEEEDPARQGDNNSSLVQEEFNPQYTGLRHLHDGVDPWIFPQGMVKVSEIALTLVCVELNI